MDRCGVGHKNSYRLNKKFQMPLVHFEKHFNWPSKPMHFKYVLRSEIFVCAKYQRPILYSLWSGLSLSIE